MSNEEDVTKSVVTISPTFAPHGSPPPDTIFRSSDHVLFYVNSTILLRVTKHAFEPILQSSLRTLQLDPSRNHIHIPDNSAILDVILHVFYNLSLSDLVASLDILEAAVYRMNIYGLTPSSHIFQSSPLFEALYSHAANLPDPRIAMRVYALAGQHHLHSLATQTSRHLLSHSLSDLSDDLAKRMGARYLRRLMSLHLTRVAELKRIIIRPPHPHAPVSGCSWNDQKSLARAWALASSYLVWDSRPDLTAQSIRSTFSTLNEHIFCTECKKALQLRIKEVVAHWLDVKDTI